MVERLDNSGCAGEADVECSRSRPSLLPGCLSGIPLYAKILLLCALGVGTGEGVNRGGWLIASGRPVGRRWFAGGLMCWRGCRGAGFDGRLTSRPRRVRKQPLRPVLHPQGMRANRAHDGEQEPRGERSAIHLGGN